MGQNYYDDQWQTWHEGPPRRDNRWLLAFAIGLAALCLIGVCIAGYWFGLRPLLAEPTPFAPPDIPTVIGGEQTATAAAQILPPGVTNEPGATTAPLPSATAAPPTPALQSDIAIPRLAQPPTLDGSLGEWSSGPSVASAHRVYAVSGWDGSADLEVVWRLGWDDSNLYVGVTVVDDVHVQTQSGNQMFRGDSLEMQIDTNPAANATLVNPSTFQLLLSPGDFADLPPTAFRFQGTGGGQVLDAVGHSISLSAAPAADGYVLEAAIPWRDLNFTPAPGAMLRVALNANDNDRPGEAIQEVMMSSSPNRTLTNPQTWGLMALE